MSGIAQAIRTIASTGDEIFSCVGRVVSVDEDKLVCEVEPVNGKANITEVRLQATPGNNTGFFIIPMVDSYVVVTFLENEVAYLALADEVVRIVGKIEGQEIGYSSEGLSLKSVSADLKGEINKLTDELSSLCTTLTTLQVSVPAFGPSAFVMPQTVTALQQHKVKIDLVKQQLNTIIV